MIDIRPIEKKILVLMQEHFEQFTYTNHKDRTESYNKLIGLCLAIEALTGGCAYDHYDFYMESAGFRYIYAEDFEGAMSVCETISTCLWL
tara:strand:+ start:381 stop:650 length:270 start_codon:yes stop_codon:yes gene_type:complete